MNEQLVSVNWQGLQISHFFLCRRWNVVASSPLGHLFFSVFLGHLLFIQSGQSSIMSLIESPAFFHWKILLVQLLRNNMQSVNRSSQERSVAFGESESFLFQKLAPIFCFGYSLGSQTHINPASESVTQIPLALSVSHQDQLKLFQLLHYKPRSEKIILYSIT